MKTPLASLILVLPSYVKIGITHQNIRILKNCTAYLLIITPSRSILDFIPRKGGMSWIRHGWFDTTPYQNPIDVELSRTNRKLTQPRKQGRPRLTNHVARDRTPVAYIYRITEV